MSLREVATAVRHEMMLRARPKLVKKLEGDGKTFPEIVAAIEADIRKSGKRPPSYSPATAHRDIKKVLDDLNKKTEETAVHMRSLMNMQLDSLLQAHWNSAVAGDAESGRMVLQVIATRMRLFSLDKLDEKAAAALQQNFFVNPIQDLPPQAMQHVVENLALQMQAAYGIDDDEFYDFIDKFSGVLGLPSGESG